MKEGMMETIRDQIARELEEIAVRNANVLSPHDVVAFARDPATALHAQFEWDDSAAAQAYRLEQARHIIRVTVTIEAPEHDPPRRVFVSLMNDRTPDGGYRLLRDVLSDAEMRAQLLVEAFNTMRAWRRRYTHLHELAKVFATIDQMELEIESEAPAPA